MKKIVTSFALLSLLGTSCKKSDGNNTNNPATPTRSWTANGINHKVNNYTKTSDSWYAYDASMNGIIFSFKTFPVANGTYTVIDPEATLNDGQVKVDVFGATAGNTYSATSSAKTSATITFTGTKFKITLPDTWVKKPGTTDSFKVSASLDPF